MIGVSQGIVDELENLDHFDDKLSEMLSHVEEKSEESQRNADLKVFS